MSLSKEKLFDKINRLRLQIDQLDESIFRLLSQRYQVSKEIQRLKLNNGQKVDCPEREQEILQRIKTLFPQIPEDTVRGIYKEIFCWMKTTASK